SELTDMVPASPSTIEVTSQTLTAAIEALPQPIADALASIPGLQDALEALSMPADVTGTIEIPVEAMELDATEQAPLIESASDAPVADVLAPVAPPSMSSTVVSEEPALAESVA